MISHGHGVISIAIQASEGGTVREYVPETKSMRYWTVVQ